jgi:hypothetical protein
MTRSIVEKNKGLSIFNLHFGVEFLKDIPKILFLSSMLWSLPSR